MDFKAWMMMALIGVLTLHLGEEVKTGFRRQFPLGEMPLWLFIALNIVLYSYSFSTPILFHTGHKLGEP